jgi:hypothetical protein
MNNINKLKSLFFACTLAILVGCKLSVISPTGGKVESLTNGNCDADSICDIEITDADFSETFTAAPPPGFQFEKWHGGEGFNCIDSAATTCTVSLPGGALLTKRQLRAMSLVDALHEYHG